MTTIIKYKFHKIEVDVLPIFNEGFEYTCTDVNENSYISRTIASETSPTLISFKNKNIFKIETLNLDNVVELDIDNLNISDINNITNLISNSNTLNVLRAKAAVINELIPNLQTKTNAASGTIKVSDVVDHVNNNELNAKHWYVDVYRYVDLFVMMGQSNMEGQTEKPEAFEVPTYQSYTYMYHTDELAQVKHPYGEWINNQVEDEALKQSWLESPTSETWWQMEGAEGGQLGQPYGALQPYFAAEYYNKTKIPTVLAQCACGATTVGEWLPDHAQGRYALAVEKINKTIAKAEAEIDRPIRNKYLVWLQGESDGIYKTGTANYKTRFLQLWTGLKQDCGLEKCFMIRVAKFREGKYNDKPIIEAQEQLAQENDDIIIATRITGCLEYPSQNPENPTIQDGTTEGYPYVDHYTMAGYKLVGETAASKISDYIKLGLRPELEPEPYEGEITSSGEQLIVSYKYKGTASLLPTFDKTFDYRIIDSKDASGYTDRKIVANYIPERISFQAKSNLLELKYIHSSRLTTGYGMFYNCSSLTYVNMPFVTYVTTMEGMFNNCKKLKRIEGVEKWNTTRNNNWGSTFGNNNVLTNLDIRNFIVLDAHALGATFRGCYASPVENFDFSKWRVPNVQYLSGTFDGLKHVKELNLSGFRVENVSTFQTMFNNCTGLERVDLSNWKMTQEHYNWQGNGAAEVTTLTVAGMFQGCSNLVDVKLLNTDRFTAYTVAGVLPTRTADKPSTIHISMDVELDTELSDLIASRGWNVDYKKRQPEYTIISYYFDPQIGDLFPKFNEGFEYTYTDEVGLYDTILRTIKSDSLPTSMHFGTDHVSQEDADSLTYVLDVNTSNISDLSGMFKNCRNLELIPSGLTTKTATNLSHIFEGCTKLDTCYTYRWETDNVVDMSYMFKGCDYLRAIGIEEFTVNENTNIEGMFEGCTDLQVIRATPEIFNVIASVLPDRPFEQPGSITLRTNGSDDKDSDYEKLTCDEEMLKHNWLTDRNRHMDLFVMMGQSNMQGQSEIYKEFNVPYYQSCTYLYNKDELSQVKHPFGENIQTLGTIEELGYYQLEGAVGCDTGLPYGSLSPHFAASYYEKTHTPTLMVQCARGATTMKDWLPGTTQQRFEIAVEKTQKSIAAVEEIGRTIRGKYLVWLQGESDGVGTGTGSKKSTYKTRFLQFWNAIKAELGFEKCFIIRVHKFRDGYSYNCFPIIDAQEELALENDDIELVTRVTAYLEYYDENPEHYTIQHAYQGLQIVSNHDHYTWEGYKLVGDTAGSRVGEYVNTGIMPELEPDPWSDKVTASNKYHVTTYKFDNTVYANYLPEFNDGYQYSVTDTVEGNITTRKIIGVGLPTLMRFGAYYTYEELEEQARTATERELSLLEIIHANTSAVTDASNMFCLNSKLTSLPAITIKNCPSLYAMFYKCTALTHIDARNFDLSKTTNLENFTWQCTNLLSVDTRGWDLSNVNNMYTMFINAQKLQEIKGVEDWDVSNAKTMISVFYACRVLQNLDLSKWDVGNVTTIWWMFNGCLKLESLNLSNWHLTNCIDYTDPFKNCKVLNNIIMKNSDYETVNNIISVLPTKTSAAPGTIIIDGVDKYDQVDLATAQAKYWNVEYTYDMSEFNKKVVSVEQLNNFAIKFNKKIKTEIVSIDTGVEETDLMTMLSEIYGDNQEE
jgi:surface protein